MRNGSPSCAPARTNEALGFDRCAPAAHLPSREFDRTRPRAKVFLSTPASARRMTDPSASPLAELESAVLHSRSDRAAAATVDAIRAKVPLTDVVRTTARAFASHYDRASGVAPRSLVALSSALNLLPAMQPRFHALPVLQAVSFVAAEKKTNAPTKPAAVVSGEITHLGRSFLFAVPDGNRAQAESIFLGMLAEGKERKMAGDMLFRAAIEAMGEGGRKLMVAVKSWQLAHSLGFKDARLIRGLRFGISCEDRGTGSPSTRSSPPSGRSGSTSRASPRVAVPSMKRAGPASMRRCPRQTTPPSFCRPSRSSETATPRHRSRRCSPGRQRCASWPRKATIWPRP